MICGSDIDLQVTRTRDRPLASLSVKVGIVVAMVALGNWFLALYLNPLSFWLCVAAVPVIVLYPLAKRVFTPTSTFNCLGRGGVD